MQLMPRYILFLCLGAAPATLLAQQKSDTTIKSQTIQIHQTYKPEIKASEKVAVAPQLPATELAAPVLHYNIPQQSLYFTYQSIPIRPLAMGVDTVKDQHNYYLKLGYGNYNTPLINAGISYGKEGEFGITADYEHLSGKGKIANQNFSRNIFNLNGNLISKRHAYDANIQIARRAFNYYGYDHSAYDYSKSQTQQVFTSGMVTIKGHNTVANKWNLDYQPEATFSLYGDKSGASEQTVAFKAPVQKHFSEYIFGGLALEANFTQFQLKSFTRGNNLVAITPSLNLVKEGVTLNLGVAPTFTSPGTAYLLPKIYAAYSITDNRFTVFGGWEGRMEQNTYQRLSTMNPYMFNNYTMLNTKRMELYAGLKGTAGSHISFEGRVGYVSWEHLPVFLNDTLTDNKQFNVLYNNKVNALRIYGNFQYQLEQKLQLRFALDWYNYLNWTSNMDKLWHTPSLTTIAGAKYSPVKKLDITVDMMTRSRMFALDKGNNRQTVQPYLDLNAGATYRLIDNVQLFMQVNNLFNNKYEQWYGYPVYGTNIVAGGLISF